MISALKFSESAAQEYIVSQGGQERCFAHLCAPPAVSVGVPRRDLRRPLSTAEVNSMDEEIAQIKRMLELGAIVPIHQAEVATAEERGAPAVGGAIYIRLWPVCAPLWRCVRWVYPRQCRSPFC